MTKNIIRLTESDLHRIVKESVERILNEVEFGGESLHGNNAEDWATMMHLRDANVNRDERLAKNKFYKNSNDATNSAIYNRIQGLKDLKNANQTSSATPRSYSDIMDNGREKAKRIIKNRNSQEMNKQFGGGW